MYKSTFPKNILSALFFLLFFLNFSNVSAQISWDNLFAKADKQFLKGKYSSAISKAKSLNKTIQKKYQGKQNLVAWMDIYEAYFLENNAEYAAMEEKIKAAILRLEANQEDFENYVVGITKIADLYLSAGYFAKVEAMMQDLKLKSENKNLADDFLKAEINTRLLMAQAYREELKEVDTNLPELTKTWDKLSKEKENKNGKLSSADLAYRSRQYACLLTLAGEIFTLKGEYPKADSALSKNESLISKLYGSHPDNAQFALALGQVYFDAENFEKAEKTFEKALKNVKPVHKNHLLVLEKLALTQIYNASPSTALKSISQLEALASKINKNENIYHLKSDWLRIQNEMDKDLDKTALEQMSAELENIIKTPINVLPKENNLRLDSYLSLTEVFNKPNLKIDAKAEENLKKALNLSKEIYGETALTYKYLQTRLANHYLTTSEDYEKVREILKDENFKDLLSQRSDLHKDFIPLSRTIAEYYDITDRYKEALELTKRCTEIVKKKYGEKDVDYGKQLVRLAEIQVKIGEYRNAEENMKAGSKIIRKEISKKSIEYADALSTMAKINGIIGLYDEAEDLLRTASKIYDKNEVADITTRAKSIEELAFLYIRIGEYTETERLLNEILISKEAKYGKESLQLINPLNQLGTLELIKGNYANAEKLLSKSVTISQKVYGDKSLKTATSLGLMSKFYQNIGDYEQAEDLIKRVIAIDEKQLGFNHIELGNAYIDLAKIIFEKDKKNNEQAFELLEKAKKIIASNFDNRHPLYAEVLKNQGEILAKTAKYDEAIKILNEANNIWLEKLEKRNINSAQVYSLMGDVQVKQKRFKDAQGNYNKAIEIYKKMLSEEHPDYVKTLSKLGQMYFVSGDLKQSNEILEKTTASYLNFIKVYFPSLSENEKSKFWKKIQTDFEFYNSLAVKQAETSPRFLENMYNFRLATKAILLSSSIKVRQSILKGTDEKLKEKYQNWLAKKEQLTSILSLSAEQLAENEINPENLRNEINQIEKELSESSDIFAESVENEVYTWEDVRKSLEKDEAAIEIIRYREFQDGFTDSIRYAALIVSPETRKHPELVLLKNGNQLEDRYLKYYRNSMRFQKDDKYSYLNYWKAISLSSALADKNKKGENITKKIYFSPDGVYNQLNVESFLIETDKYVIDEVNVRLVSNTKDLVINKLQKENIKPRKKKKIAENQRTAILFGNPTFYTSAEIANKIKKESESEEEESLGYIAELPATAVEIDEINQILTAKNIKTEVYTESTAGERRLKELNSPYIVHIATHGFFEESKPETDELETSLSRNILNDPLRKSGLLSRGAGDLLSKTSFNFDLEEGILTASEASNLMLDGTEIVVLSACETGLGEVAIGEGVYGLQRSFLVAGAKSLIMSLFRVNDEITQKLMTKFYQKWLSTGNKRQAFNDAQKEIKSEYKYPSYWGAFNMIGVE